MKNYNEEIKKLILQITSIGIVVSKTTENDIFINYSGHADLFEVRCIYGGFKEDHSHNSENLFYSYLDKMCIEDIDELRNVKDKLIDMLGGVNSEEGF